MEIPNQKELLRFTNRKRDLVVMGKANIFLGILCFILGVLIGPGISLTGLNNVEFARLMSGIAFYFFFLATWYIWLGCGSICATRWARMLLLAGAWIGISFGAPALSMAIYVLSKLYELRTGSEAVPGFILQSIFYFATGVMILVYLVFPLISIIFYGNENVRCTCEFYHPQPCWIDRCPTSLIAIGMLCAISYMAFFTARATHCLTFCYGRVLTNWQGGLVIALVAAVYGFVGWGAFKRRIYAWWGAYGLIVVIASSVMLTFAGIDIENLFYTLGNRLPAQVARVRDIYPLSPPVIIIISCLWGIVACICLVWVRERFETERGEIYQPSYRMCKAAGKNKEREPSVRMRRDD